ncbi:MAG: hypothetical protein ABIP90_03565 [Vicinamibacterales bacterium]
MTTRPGPSRRPMVFALFALTLASSAGAGAQGPWNLRIKPAATSLVVGVCTPVRLDLLNPSGKEAPRNGAGTLVSIADFDMSVTAEGGTVVGRYDGAGAWSACPCTGAGGATATITATYPSRSMNPKARVAGVSFKSTVSVPVTANAGIVGTPVGCELIKTTTARVTTANASPGLGTGVPWTVTLTSGLNALPVGVCSALRLDLRDATGKEEPRNAAGQRPTLADFDLTVSSNSGAVVGAYDGTTWSACPCQGAAVGTPATITATYPARTLAPASRVPGVVFQSSLTLPLTAAQGPANPPGCGG